MTVAHAQTRRIHRAVAPMANPAVRLLERFGSPLAATSKPAERIDREKKVIRGVKVLSPQSGNTGRVIGLDAKQFGAAIDKPYRYTIEAMKAAVPLYEGMTVRVDHPDFKYKANGERVTQKRDREVIETFGRLVNVRHVQGATLDESGIFADLEYLDAHPLCEMILEMAERMPEKIPLSHDSVGRLVLKDGEVVVESIQKVNSVDLVGGTPGTNKSLFETEHPMATEMDPAALRNSTVAQRSTCEEDGSTEGAPSEEAGEMVETDTPVDAEADPEIDHAEAVGAAFKDLVLKVMCDDTLDEKAQIKKITAIIKAKNNALAAIGGEEEAEPSEEVEAAESAAEVASVEGKGAANKPTVESLSAEITRFEAKDRAREMLAEAGIAQKASLVEALAALSTDAKRKAFINDYPKTTGAGAGRPRSATARVTESKAKNEQPAPIGPATPKEMMRALRGLN